MDYVGISNRKRYRLAEPAIAGGGEGNIYSIVGDPGQVAKVYLHPERVEQDKLRFMVMETHGYYGQLINSAIAWPLDALMDGEGQILGFVMKKCPGVTKLAEVLPDNSIDWGKKVIIAWNLCEIVQDVEKMNQCIGDMNPSNFGVDLKSGKVYAFDADSFHFRASTGRLYPCCVGIAEYYAPELQRQITRGQDMRTLDPEHTFSQQTDRFALAVLLFQLLFAGYHPFSARRLEKYGSSTVVHRQSTNILNKVCAYFNPMPGTGIPKGAPQISIIPTEMQEMFRRAFLTEDRPSATEWQGALSDLLRHLKKCSREHYYYSKLSRCPWCENPAPDMDKKPDKTNTVDLNDADGKTPASNPGVKTPASNPALKKEEKAKKTLSVEQQSARRYSVVLCVAWALMLFFLPVYGEEGASTFGPFFARLQEGNLWVLLFLLVPFIGCFFVFKGEARFLRTIGCIILGYTAMMDLFILAYYLDDILDLHIFLTEESPDILTGVFMVAMIAFGFYSGKKCAKASE